MKRISSLLAGSALFLVASCGMAASMTSMDSKWNCTTNASSSSVATEAAADKEMSDVQKSAADSFAFAAKNCRDCTKITCSASN